MRSSPESAFREHVAVDAFPEAQDLSVADCRRILTDYLDEAILRDGGERHRVSSVVSPRRPIATC